jgi:hypothetical protein
MPAAIPIVAGEAALAMGAEAAAMAAAEAAAQAAAIEAAQVAAAEAAAQAAATAAAEQAAATAATNAATNQSILSAIGAGGGAPTSAALGGVEAGLGGASSAYTGATSAMAGTPAYGMPAGLEQIGAVNPAFTEMSAAELAQIQGGIPQAGPGVQIAGDMSAVSPDVLTQGAQETATGASGYTGGTSAYTGTPAYATPSVSEYASAMPLTEVTPTPPPSTLEGAFNKAIDWVKDNKMTTALGAAQLFKGKGGKKEEKKEYDGILSKYKISPDFQGRQANPEDYQYAPKTYNMAVGGITQASPNNQIPFPNTQLLLFDK